VRPVSRCGIAETCANGRSTKFAKQRSGDIASLPILRS
jgi:hypothetical protein